MPVKDLEESVAKKMRISKTDRFEMYDAKKTRWSYRLMWARLYLRREGFLVKGARGISTLSEKGLSAIVPA